MIDRNDILICCYMNMYFVIKEIDIICFANLLGFYLIAGLNSQCWAVPYFQHPYFSCPGSFDCFSWLLGNIFSWNFHFSFFWVARCHKLVKILIRLLHLHLSSKNAPKSKIIFGRGGRIRRWSRTLLCLSLWDLVDNSLSLFAAELMY